MIWALVSTFIGSIVSIFRKKSLTLTDLTGIRFLIFGFSGGFILGTIFLILGKVDLGVLINWKFLLLFIIVITIDIIGAKIEQGIYKVEKYSVLLPFENLNKIFVVIAGFFLFGNTSLTTFSITILTIIIIILFSIDFKNFKLPTYIYSIILTNVMWATQTILMTYLLKITNIQTFFALNDLIKGTILAITIVFLFKKDALELFKQSKKFYSFRVSAGLLGGVNFLIILFLMKELGVVTTILLSFLGMVAKLIFSYIVLKEIPGKKDVILAFIVASLIGIGYYLG